MAVGRPLVGPRLPALLRQPAAERAPDTVTVASHRGGTMVALVEPRRPFIDGKYVPGDGPALAVENPATEETIAEVETASTAQIEQAIGAARRSFDDGVWSEMPARRARGGRAAHGRVPRRPARPARRHRDRGGGRAVRERDRRSRSAPRSTTRAPIPDLYLAARASRSTTRSRRPVTRRPATWRVSMNVYEPVGVVSAISAYNFPVLPERVEDAARR